MLQKLLYGYFLCLIPAASYGQTFIMNGTPIAACSGTFLDNGGSGDYSNDLNLTTTICPDGNNGSHLSLRFDSLELGAGDTLCVYNGPDILAPVLTCMPPLPASLPFQVSASVANNSGCLTLVFVSDGSATAAGWSASISCGAPCLIPAPVNVQVVAMNGGNMVWTWDNVPGSSGFEVSVNGGAWQPATGALSHTVSGLGPGDLVVLEIRPVSTDPGCTVESITVNKVYVECTLSATLVSSLPARCFGTATGSAVVSASGASGAVQFFADSNPVAFPNGNFNSFFAAGDHRVILVDAAGCRDTVTFQIDQPDSIRINITVTDAQCFGDNSGAIQAAATGGTPPFTYAWQSCQGGMTMPGATAIDLFAGCYAVTVTDSRGCTQVARDTVGEPEKFQFAAQQDSVRCFGGSDGRATVFVSGAKPPYQYRWSNGDITQTADSLKAGFHSVTITDADSCQAVTLVQVLEPARLVIDSLVLSPISCFGANNGAISVIANGGVKPYAYLWNTMQSGAVLSGLSPGPYTVTLTDIKGCTVSRSATLNAPPELVVQITTVQDESCANACDGSLSLAISGGNGPYTVAWDNPLIPAGATSPGSLCAGAYQVTVSDAKGCTRTNSATILAATPLSVQFAGVGPSCAGGQNGTASASVAGGKSPYQYLWNTGASTNALTGLPCGAYTVTITDQAGCTVSASGILPCATPLLVDSLSSLPVRCFGEANGSATVFASGGTGAFSYLWSDSNQQFDSIAVNLAPGTYTVTVSDANNCTATATATIGEPPPIQSAISTTPVTCFGGNDGTATANTSGGVLPYQYAWSVPQNTPIVNGLPAGTYALTITDASGCPFTLTGIVIQQPATPVQATASQTRWACFGSSNGEAAATASGSNGGPYSFAWSNGASGPAPSNFASGLYTVTATDAKGCTGTQTLTIQAWDSIKVNVAFVLPSCNGRPDGQAAVNLVSGGAGNGVIDNYTFQWSVPGTGDTIYVSGLSGNQNYTLTVTDNAGCSRVFEYFLNDRPPLVPVLQADSVSCFGLSDGAARVTSVQSSQPISSYVWNDNTSGQTLLNLPAGIYTVVVTDNLGCTGSASITVAQPDLLALNFDVQPLVCNNDSNGVVRALVQGGTPGYAFVWNTGATSDRIQNLGPGDYAVTVTDQKGCTAERNITLSQPNPPVVALELVQPACFGNKDGLVRLLVSDGSPPYKFSLDGQTFSGSSVFLGLAAGNYTAYVRDNAGCLTAVTFSLVDPPPLTLTISPDTTITLGDSIQLFAEAFNAFGITQFSWRGALIDSIVCQDPPDCSSVWVSPVYNNQYTVSAVDENGCQASASVQVTVDKPRGVYVPSGFSPNSDGNNELLGVFGKSQQITRVKVFRIFDRWGELVYEDFDFSVNNPQRGWDGQYRGEKSQAGVYVWYLEVEYLDGYTQQLQGNTMLIR